MDSPSLPRGRQGNEEITQRDQYFGLLRARAECFNRTQAYWTNRARVPNNSVALAGFIRNPCMPSRRQRVRYSSAEFAVNAMIGVSA
jgi:hypothetical protein